MCRCNKVRLPLKVSYLVTPRGPLSTTESWFVKQFKVSYIESLGENLEK